MTTELEVNVKILTFEAMYCTECHRRTRAGEEVVLFRDPGNTVHSRWMCPDCMPNASDEYKLRLIKYRMTT